MSVARFTTNNNVFSEFHPSYCSINDRFTKTKVLRGSFKNELNNISQPKRIKQVFNVSRAITSSFQTIICNHHFLCYFSFLVTVTKFLNFVKHVTLEKLISSHFRLLCQKLLLHLIYYIMMLRTDSYFLNLWLPIFDYLCY